MTVIRLAVGELMWRCDEIADAIMRTATDMEEAIAAPSPALYGRSPSPATRGRMNSEPRVLKGCAGG